jgi:SAM-dependent methyltransferase
MDMLDLGVGAGRTARHFAPRVKSYVGLDYSRSMIAHCRQVLPDYTFVVGDARRLDFDDKSYDFVLFSFNGIDHLGPADRQQALREMKRVLRPNGMMFFSSHNSNFLPVIIDRFRFRLQRNARETARSLKWAAVFQLHNPTLRFRLPLEAGMIHDGTHAFRSAGCYYIRPDLQVSALRRLGMIDILCAPNEVAAFTPGTDPAVASFDSAWVYFLCRKPEFD